VFLRWLPREGSQKGAIHRKEVDQMVTNNHDQSVHEDSRVYIQEADRLRWGGARMIDAQTFVKEHPNTKLQDGFTVGTYHYDTLV